MNGSNEKNRHFGKEDLELSRVWNRTHWYFGKSLDKKGYLRVEEEKSAFLEKKVF